MSTRGLACHVWEPQVFLYTAGTGWQKSAWEKFLEMLEPGVPLVFVVHGACNSEVEAISKGWEVVQQLGGSPDKQSCPNAPSRPMMRVVIWSWPADRTHRRLMNDWQAQDQISFCEGERLAQALARIPDQVPTRLVGYSLGAQVVLRALHLLGSGLGRSNLEAHRPKEPRSSHSRQVRVVLMAAAVRHHWLLPGQPFAKALQPVERMLVIYNPCDRLLRRYHRLDRDRSVRAIGVSGIAGLERLQGGEKLRYLQATPWVGKKHRWQYYVASGIIGQRLRGFLLGVD